LCLAHHVAKVHCRFAPDREQACSHAFGRIKSWRRGDCHCRNNPTPTSPIRVCPEGVGVQLADDLPGTGSNIKQLGCAWLTTLAGFAAASRQIADKSGSYAFGRIKS
jgi:hypothetical protein